MVQSSRKGAGFERTVAKRLSLWLSCGERDDLLWRTAMSGGRATLQRQKGKRASAQAGDIGSIDEASSWFTQRFFVEAKHLKDMNLTSFILKRQGILYNNLKKARGEAEEEGKSLFFVAKQNNYPDFLMVEEDVIIWARGHQLWPLAQVGDLQLYSFEEFLSLASAEDLKRGLLLERSDEDDC